MRKNLKTHASIHQKTPVGELVHQVNQRARDNGVKVSLASRFPKEHGATHLPALSSWTQWTWPWIGRIGDVGACSCGSGGNR